MKSLVAWTTRQFRFVVIRKHLNGSHPPRVLDVGCGENSPELTRRELEGCEYHSLDLKPPEEILKKHGAEVAARYRCIDLEALGLQPLAGGQFDVVVISHVIEHIDNGLAVVRQAADLLAPGGVIYVEYPRLASVNFVSMEGTLNFHDDPTHKRVYSLVDVTNALLAGGLVVRAAAVRRMWRRILLMPAGVLYSIIRYRKLRAGLFWDLLGFAEYAVAIRPRRRVR